MPRRIFPTFPIKVDELLSVEQLGATGDGTTNDTVAFNATIAQLPSNGGVIYVPEGNFIVTTGSLVTGGRTLFWLLNGQVNTSWTAAGSGLPGTVINDASSSIAAEDVSITDTGGYFTGTDVEAALQEIGADLAAGAAGLANVVEDLTPQLGGPLDVNAQIITSAAAGNVVLEPDTTGEIRLNAAVVTVEDDIVHAGDTNNLISFTTDAQSFETGGSSRLDISDTGVRLGGANARVTTVLDEDAMTTNSATALATQQSIKAYVDAQIATVSGGNVSVETPKAASSGTTVDFTGLPAGIDEIKIAMHLVSTNGSSPITLELGHSAGTFQTSGYFSNASNDANQTADTTAFALVQATVASSTASGVLTLSKVNDTGDIWALSGVLHTATGSGIYFCAGSVALAAELDAVRLTTVNGTDAFDGAGQINLKYWLAA